MANVFYYVLRSIPWSETRLADVDRDVNEPWVWGLLAQNEYVTKDVNERKSILKIIENFNLCDDINNIIYKFVFDALENEKLTFKKLANPKDKFFSYEEYSYDTSMLLEEIKHSFSDYNMTIYPLYGGDGIFDFTLLSEDDNIPLNFVDEFIDKAWDWKRLSENARIVREFKKRDCVYKMFNEMGFSEYVVDLISDFSFYKLNNRKLIWEKLKIN